MTISKFSVTDADGLRFAYEPGLRDGEDFAEAIAGRMNFLRASPAKRKNLRQIPAAKCSREVCRMRRPEGMGRCPFDETGGLRKGEFKSIAAGKNSVPGLFRRNRKSPFARSLEACSITHPGGLTCCPPRKCHVQRHRMEWFGPPQDGLITPDLTASAPAATALMRRDFRGRFRESALRRTDGCRTSPMRPAATRPRYLDILSQGLST